jgi:uncharacterized membrane protein YqgA involved in biofilm formation
MIGTILNVAGIVIGGAVGLARRSPLSAANEAFAKVALSAFTVFYGLRLTWISMSGPFMHVLKELIIILLAMSLGKLLGRLLRLQQTSNRIGRWAHEQIKGAKPEDPGRMSAGFKACAALFCTEPLGLLGAVQDGLTSPPYFYTLAIKGVVDGLAAMGLVSLFGRGVVLSAIPVLAFQGTITILCSRLLEPVLSARDLVDPVNMVGGLLVFSVALVMMGVRKIELADYLPSLALAPLIAWMWS